MTNAEIILNNSVFLMEQGLLKPTAQKVTITDEEGNKKESFLPEPIHTFQAWKALGYSVKKGEHAIAKFPIWKPAGKKQEQKQEGDDEKEFGRMFMKMAFFFTADQVQKTEAR